MNKGTVNNNTLTYREFRDFLRRKNCNDAFDRAFYEQNDCTRFDTALWDAVEDIRSIFRCLFKWCKTPEGEDFWRAVDIEWYCKCENKNCICRETHA